MTDARRYRYEQYSDKHGLNDWSRRAQWLVFDCHGVGCMASLCTEADAAKIVTALNAYHEPVNLTPLINAWNGHSDV